MIWVTGRLDMHTSHWLQIRGSTGQQANEIGVPGIIGLCDVMLATEI